MIFEVGAGRFSFCGRFEVGAGSFVRPAGGLPDLEQLGSSWVLLSPVRLLMVSVWVILTSVRAFVMVQVRILALVMGGF